MMREKSLIIDARLEIRVVGDAKYASCSSRCSWFVPHRCGLFQCRLLRAADGLWSRCRDCLESSEDLREKYPALRGARYVPLTRVAAVDSRYVRHAGVRFWIYVLCTAPLPDNLPVRAKQVKKNVPREIARGMDPEEIAAFSAAMDGPVPVWFLKIEDKGWDWGARNGAKDVAAVQDLLAWVKRFETQTTYNGARLIHAEITNQFV